jgi:hypothetical protein
MSGQRFLWRVFCLFTNTYEVTISETEPTVCPVDGQAIDSTATVILQSQYKDISTVGYINIDSSLADNNAIRISASDTNGGIDINAGFGGITVDTTNTISLDAASASNFTTTLGNLDLEATDAGSGGLINIDADAGVNIGSDASANATNTPIVNIGSSANSKTITIGNMTGTTTVNVLTGSGGFNVDTATGGTISLDAMASACNFTINTTGDGQDLNLAVLGSTNSSIILTSQGTGADAIKLDTVGGLTVDAVSGITMSSGSSASFSMVGGSGGVLINTAGGSGGAIGLGNFTGGDMFIGNAAVARTITFGNSTGATTVNLASGTGGFNVDTATGGPISLDATGSISNFTVTTTGDAQDLTIAITGTTDSSIILSSSGTGADSIRLFATGGIDIDCTGNYTLDTGSSSSINFVSGSAGVLINTASGSGGAIGIGNFNGGDMFIGNAAVARTITFGNSTGATRIFARWGTGGLVTHQSTAVNITGSTTATTSDLLAGIITGTPSAAHFTLTLPTAANIVSGISGVTVDDCIDFIIINSSTPTDEKDIIIAVNTGGTLVGYDTVNTFSNLAGTYFTSGSGIFRLRLTNVSSSTEAYTVYRIA